MRKRYVILMLVLIALVLVSNSDRYFQSYMLIEKMDKMSQRLLEDTYGKEVAAVFDLYHEQDYNKPKIKMLDNTANESFVRVYTTQKDPNNPGGVYYSEHQQILKIIYYPIPILNIDIIKEIEVIN